MATASSPSPEHNGPTPNERNDEALPGLINLRDPSEPLQAVWNKRFTEFGFFLGLVPSALIGLWVIGESIVVPMLNPSKQHPETAAGVAGGLVLCVCSPLIGLFGALAFGGIADLFQLLGYIVSGRYRRTPNTSAIINQLEEMEEDELYKDFHEWQSEDSSDDEGIQLPQD